MKMLNKENPYVQEIERVSRGKIGDSELYAKLKKQQKMPKDLKEYYKSFAKKPQRVQKTQEQHDSSSDSESIYSSDNISDTSPIQNHKKNKEYDELAKQMKRLQKKMAVYER